MKSMRSLYKKLFHYVPDKRILAYFSMALSAAAVCSYMGAYWFLWQSIVSILVIPVYEKAMYDAIIVVILMILRGILNIASATCSHYLGFRLETNLRKNGLHKLLDASSSFFDHNSSGEIRKIIDDNAAETHKTVAHLIPDNVTAVMTPVLMFVLMFAIDYRLGILLILTTVIGVLQYRKMSGGTEFLSGYSAALQKMSAATVEYVRGMQIIKIFGVTVQYYKTLINSIKEYKQYVYQYSLSCKNPYVGFQVLFNVFYALLYQPQLYSSAMENLLCYQKDTQVIRHASFTAEQGQVTALVGPSGCGKTTMLKLISRLYDADSGTVQIGGTDIREIHTDSLFKYVSIVFQEVILFNTSIMENIRLGRLDASDEEVIRAAKLAGCNEFVSRLPDTYQTIIGENGAKLSGGERQRLSIARAILKDAPIIILDEIAASLDVETEVQIQTGLNHLIQGKTVIVISHRLKSIENADKIVVMKAGTVEACGKHAHLLKQSPTYRKMIEKSNLAEKFNY